MQVNSEVNSYTTTESKDSRLSRRTGFLKGKLEINWIKIKAGGEIKIGSERRMSVLQKPLNQNVELILFSEIKAYPGLGSFEQQRFGNR